MNYKNIEQLSNNIEVQKLMHHSLKEEWWADDPWRVIRASNLFPVSQKPGVYIPDEYVDDPWWPL